MSEENDITLPPEYMERDFQRVQQGAQTRQRLLKILFWAALSFVMILAFSF